MDFVEGTSLAAQIAKGPLVARDAARMMQQIAEAVAHEHGVIHRDLKPANVLLDVDGQPKITDFGLAKRIDSVSELTQTGQILGTASYMSPEQGSGLAAEVGPESDVFSCGAMLYAMLTGRPPFQSASPLETIRQVVNDDPVAPSQLAPDIPRDLETICLRCLHKVPNRRCQSANDLAEDLGRFLSGRPVLARPVGKLERLVRWSQRNPVIARLAVALSISVLGGLLVTTTLWIGAASVAVQLAISLDAERDARQSAVDARNDAIAAQQNAEQQTLAASRRLLQANCSEIQRLLDAPVPNRVAKIQATLRESVDLLNVVSASEAECDRVRDLALNSLTIPLDVSERRQLAFGRAKYFTAFDTKLKRFARKLPDRNVVVGQVDDPDANIVLPTPPGCDSSLLIFSPNGKRLAGRYGNRCLVWDLESQKVILESPMQEYAMSFHADGSRLSICDRPG